MILQMTHHCFQACMTLNSAIPLDSDLKKNVTLGLQMENDLQF